MTDTLSRPTYKAFTERAPDVYAGLSALTKAVDASSLDKGLTELVKLRASQINGCAFCLKFHLGVARKAGVPQDKLDLLAALAGCAGILGAGTGGACLCGRADAA